jgi:hypothetical protein
VHLEEEIKMEERKLFERLEKEFSGTFYVSKENDGKIFCLSNRLYDHLVIQFTVTQEYVLKPFIVETHPSIQVNMLPSMRLKTEDQVVELIKYIYRYLRGNVKKGTQ